MTPTQLEKLAHTLVHKCLEIKPGARVLIMLTGPAGLPLVQACFEKVIAAGGEAALRPALTALNYILLNTASDEQLDEVPEADLQLLKWATARIYIDAPDMPEELPPQPDPVRSARRQRALGPVQAAMRNISGPICNYPTPELARRAGMTLGEYTEFVLAACDYDWDEMQSRLDGAMAKFEDGDMVRLVAAGTDISFRIKNVPRFVSVGKGNMPSGEIYFSPIADSTEGYITYEWPCILRGVQVTGVRLAFQAGAVVGATADEGEEFLLATLDTDPGARRLGEFGIGLNPNIQRFTNNILYDEKIGGTIHLALGQAYGDGNQSLIHWDMVKDMRQNSAIYVDGRLIYKDGGFLD